MTLENWLLTGIPRGGTSVCTRLLAELPDTVALSEPLQNSDFTDCPDPTSAAARIAERLAQIRRQVVEEGTAPALNVSGQLSDQRVEAPGGNAGLRRPQGHVSDIPVAASLSGDFRLVVKQNALFTALLGELRKHFHCLALVRNPLEVLASWQTVDLPVNRGRLPAGERYDAALSGALDATENVLERQLLILDWFFARYRESLPGERILRFEQVRESGAQVLAEALGIEGPAAEPLAREPLAQRFPHLDLQALLSAILQGPTTWRHFYAEADCERALGD